MVLRPLVTSFARGELSPLLHARPDITMFQTGLAKCENFIVLPQGGATRRPGWKRHTELGEWRGDDCPVRLIPFIYSTEDSHVIALSDRAAKAISSRDGHRTVSFNSPYTIGQAREIRYVQSGNEIFMAQKDVPVQRLKRGGAIGAPAFEFVPLEYRNGPWLTSDKRTGSVKLMADGMTLQADTRGFFTQRDEGKLFEVNYQIPQGQVTVNGGTGTAYSEPIEVGSEWYFRTTGSWVGTITLQRLPAGKDKNNDTEWQDWRPHRRDNANEVGNAELSGSEDELNILYRIKMDITGGSGFASVTASGFTKTNTFKIITVTLDGYYATVEWIKEFDDLDDRPYQSADFTSDWRIGAWGGDNRYPRAVAFYQDRLCLAGTETQTQGIWMSATGDYNAFGTTSGNLKDDDAISINIAAQDMSGIHSLYAGSDLIAFTSSSEWRIKGSGENGAITPTAITAHKQTNIGSAPIQPFDADGAVVLAQTHGGEIHTLKYAFELDGYSGSNLSVLSEHLFCKSKIIDMAYQQIPDSQIWVVLDDGDAACCTFQQEHQVFAWTHHKTDGIIGSICVVPNVKGYSEVWAVIKRDGVWAIETLADSKEGIYTDDGKPYESILATLRFPPNGETFRAKKFIGRVAVYGLYSAECKISPVTDKDNKRWRKMKFPDPLGIEAMYQLQEADIQLDAGFERHAGVKIWTEENKPLTILAISPELTMGE